MVNQKNDVTNQNDDVPDDSSSGGEDFLGFEEQDAADLVHAKEPRPRAFLV